MRQVRNGFFLVAGALALVACASHPPASSTAPAATSSSASVAAAATPAATADTAKATVPKGYKRVVKHNTEYFCRTLAVTGSHTQKNEICLTRDQLEAEKTNSEQIELNHAAAAAR